MRQVKTAVGDHVSKAYYHHKAREKGLKECVMGDLLRIYEREIKKFVISRLYLFLSSDMSYTFSIYLMLDKLSGSS